MQKKPNRKLFLSKETLRALNPRDLAQADGGGTTMTSEASNPSLTCDQTCMACTTSHAATHCC